MMPPGRRLIALFAPRFLALFAAYMAAMVMMGGVEFAVKEPQFIVVPFASFWAGRRFGRLEGIQPPIGALWGASSLCGLGAATMTGTTPFLARLMGFPRLKGFLGLEDSAFAWLYLEGLRVIGFIIMIVGGFLQGAQSAGAPDVSERSDAFK